jgi:hypothetical protein
LTDARPSAPKSAKDGGQGVQSEVLENDLQARSQGAALEIVADHIDTEPDTPISTSSIPDDADELDMDDASEGDSVTSSISALSMPESPIPTTYLGETFEGLPFGPDVPAVRHLSCAESR